MCPFSPAPTLAFPAPPPHFIFDTHHPMDGCPPPSQVEAVDGLVLASFSSPAAGLRWAAKCQHDMTMLPWPQVRVCVGGGGNRL
mgnify:CR=1 FL=1